MAGGGQCAHCCLQGGLSLPTCCSPYAKVIPALKPITIWNLSPVQSALICVKKFRLKPACAKEKSCSIVIDMCTLSESRHITAHRACDYRLAAVRFLRRVSNLTSHLHAQSPKHDVATELISSMYDQRRMPHFLSNAAPDAEVHSGFLDILDNFQQDQDGREHLADTVKELTGELWFLWLFGNQPSDQSSSIAVP